MPSTPLVARFVRSGTRPRLLALLALSLASFASASASAIEPRQVDALFRTWDKPDTPGVALTVIRDGAIIYERGYGQAVLPASASAQSQPITPETVFYIGSVSKQFAAACIALLHQRGVLSLDDDVRKYVPELPDYGTPITLRHCVHHTSGLRDYLALRSLAGEPGDATFGNDEVLALLRRQKSLNFPPGTRHLYSNSGYWLLSLVVQRTTGKSLRDFAAENLFGPLGMKTTQFRDNHAQLIANRANGYGLDATAKTYRVSNPNFDVVGAGGVFMTVRDFLAWDQNFYTPKIGDAAFLSLLQTPGQLSDGTTLTYAFGLQVGKYRGLDIVEHGGAYGGFRAHVIRFPAQRFSVVCFANLASMVPSRLTRQVADLYLRDAFTAPATVEAIVPPPAKKTKAAPIKITADAAATLAGTYHSDELELSCRLTADASGKLTLHHPRLRTLPLVPLRADEFTAGVSRLVFERREDKIVAFTLHEGRASGLVFTRQQ